MTHDVAPTVSCIKLFQENTEDYFYKNSLLLLVGWCQDSRDRSEADAEVFDGILKAKDGNKTVLSSCFMEENLFFFIWLE